MSSHRKFGNNQKVVARPILETDRPWMDLISIENWGSNQVVSRGRVHNILHLPGFIAEKEGVRSGFITYHMENLECEIVTLNSLVPGEGIGSRLVDAVKSCPQILDCSRIWLITTNDNTHAIRFYHLIGFSIKAIYPNEVNESRKLKPKIPLIGNDGIPIRDEIELEHILK